MAVLLLVLAIILIALIVLVGFAYLQVKALEDFFGKLENEDTVIPDQPVFQTDTYTPDYAPGEVPLEKYVPDFKKPINLKFTENEEGHGVEESEG